MNNAAISNSQPFVAQEVVPRNELSAKSAESSFQNILLQKEQRGELPKLSEGGALKSFEEQWLSRHAALERVSERLPERSRLLVELQREFYRFGLESQLLVRVGDTLSTTLRRVQQMGGG